MLEEEARKICKEINAFNRDINGISKEINFANREMNFANKKINGVDFMERGQNGQGKDSEKKKESFKQSCFQNNLIL